MGDPIQNVLDRLSGVRPSNGGYEARCPAHDDQHASLSVSRGDDGRVLLHCHAGCAPIAVCQAIDLRLSDLFPPNNNGDGLGRIVATYDYCDPKGALLFQVLRYEGKNFRQRTPPGRTRLPVRRPVGRRRRLWALGGDRTRRSTLALPTVPGSCDPAATSQAKAVEQQNRRLSASSSTARG